MVGFGVGGGGSEGSGGGVGCLIGGDRSGCGGGLMGVGGMWGQPAFNLLLGSA